MDGTDSRCHPFPPTCPARMDWARLRGQGLETTVEALTVGAGWHSTTQTFTLATPSGLSTSTAGRESNVTRYDAQLAGSWSARAEDTQLGAIGPKPAGAVVSAFSEPMTDGLSVSAAFS